MECICPMTGWSASWLHIEIRKPSPSPEISTRKSRHSCESLPPDGRRIVSWWREPTMPMIDFYAAAGTFLLLGELSASRRLSRNGVLGDWDFRLSQCTRTGVGYNSYVGIGPRTTETFRRGLKIVEAILAEFSSYLLIKR